MKLLVALLLSISCQAQTTQAPTVSNTKVDPGWKILKTTEYSIQYPSTWDLDQSGGYNTQFLLLSPLESKGDNFRENINLVIEDLQGKDIDLDQYTTLAKDQIKKYITNVNFLETTTVGKKPDIHEKVIYTGDQGVYHLNFEQYYWVKNGNAYVVTLTCEQNKVAAFKETGESIMNSFVVK